MTGTAAGVQKRVPAPLRITGTNGGHGDERIRGRPRSDDDVPDPLFRRRIYRLGRVLRRRAIPGHEQW